MPSPFIFHYPANVSFYIAFLLPSALQDGLLLIRQTPKPFALFQEAFPDHLSPGQLDHCFPVFLHTGVHTSLTALAFLMAEMAWCLLSINYAAGNIQGNTVETGSLYLNLMVPL